LLKLYATNHDYIVARLIKNHCDWLPLLFLSDQYIQNQSTETIKDGLQG